VRVSLLSAGHPVLELLRNQLSSGDPRLGPHRERVNQRHLQPRHEAGGGEQLEVRRPRRPRAGLHAQEAARKEGGTHIERERGAVWSLGCAFSKSRGRVRASEARQPLYVNSAYQSRAAPDHHQPPHVGAMAGLRTKPHNQPCERAPSALLLGISNRMTMHARGFLSRAECTLSTTDWLSLRASAPNNYGTRHTLSRSACSTD
jgi:hypothetical protein